MFYEHPLAKLLDGETMSSSEPFELHSMRKEIQTETPESSVTLDRSTNLEFLPRAIVPRWYATMSYLVHQERLSSKERALPTSWTAICLCQDYRFPEDQVISRLPWYCESIIGQNIKSMTESVAGD